MYRALFELIITIIVIAVARRVLTTVMQGIANASRDAMRQQPPNAPHVNSATNNSSTTKNAGELHKDPVCGTYVAESTPFQRHTGGQTFYYCSSACREKHALVAR